MSARLAVARRLIVLLVPAFALVFGIASARAQEPKDPYAWLEDLTSDKALDWVQERNDASVAKLNKWMELADTKERLRRLYEPHDGIPRVEKRGRWYYNFTYDTEHPHGLWRRTSFDEYRREKPEWETVLDVETLGQTEKEHWFWAGANFLTPKCERCLVSLSRGGSDATVVREFDLITKEFVKDGFTLPEGKHDVAWRDMDTVDVATDFGPDSLTKSGYARIAKEWKRGTNLEDAALICEGRPDDVEVLAFWDLTPGFEREFAQRKLPSTNTLYIRLGGKLVKIEKPDDAVASIHREWLFVTLTTDWKVNGKTYPGGALLAINFEEFLKGERNFDVLFEPTPRKSLAGLAMTRHHVLLTVLDNVSSHIYVLTHGDGEWKREALPEIPRFSTASIEPVDSDASDDYFLTVTGYLSPSTLLYGTVGGKPAEKIKADPALFDAEGLEVTQHEAISKDGTKIPYFQIARKDLKLDGSNPTVLYGYGGFEISQLPRYDYQTGVLWLEKGGVYVVANIRGGGEFGPQWHQAAVKANRMRAYEDFAAVADDLVRRKITSPKHLGAMGGSNGGLLTGNMLTLYPDRFGAIVSEVPLLDMQHYHMLLAGASWMGEYGDPDNAEDWAWLKDLSPYHNLKKDVKYPRALFITSTRDDRVHPAHARKMVAKMLDMGHDAMLCEYSEGGHRGHAETAYLFLWNELQ
jgi:prolyl oligopeptidase